ncbi:hypothetical protein B0H13DRAFT_2364300 [Mycena leptocephala]|nr:hypothetical protein B0H13DRAFT_2364300 [Mycena leptocephala]
MPWRFVSPLSPGISYHLMIDIVSVNSILLNPPSQPAPPAPLTLILFWCSSYVKMGEFDTTIGYTLLGATINTFLTGIIASQFFTYWNTKNTDSWWIRGLVVFLFVVNAMQSAAVVYMSWLYCVTNFANPQIVATILWPDAFTALITAVLALVTQTSQSWRIYMFTKSKMLVGFIIVAALGACGTGMAAAIGAWVSPELAKLPALQPVIEANLALQFVLSITLSKFKTGFNQTNRVLNRLIRTAIQSGFFTAVFALGTLLSSHFSPGTYMLAMFALPIGRIYTHTMMDHFVGREELRNMFFNRGNVISVPDFSIGGTANGRPGTMMVLGNTSSTASKVPEASHVETLLDARIRPLRASSVMASSDTGLSGADVLAFSPVTCLHVAAYYALFRILKWGLKPFYAPSPLRNIPGPAF